MHNIATDFGVDSSSRFPFRARTDKQTDTGPTRMRFSFAADSVTFHPDCTSDLERSGLEYGESTVS